MTSCHRGCHRHIVIVHFRETIFVKEYIAENWYGSVRFL